MEKDKVKIVSMLIIGIIISLYTTWEYEIGLIVIMYLSAIIIDVDDMNTLNNFPMVIIYGLGVIIGSVIALKFPEYFQVYSLQLIIN